MSKSEKEEYIASLPPEFQARIKVACGRDNEAGHVILLHDMEGAMIGTAKFTYVVEPKDANVLKDVKGPTYSRVKYGEKVKLTENQKLETIVVSVYESSRCIDELAKTFTPIADGLGKDETPEDRAYTDAMEWFDYNTKRSLPYLHECAPVMYDAFEPGERDDKLEENKVGGIIPEFPREAMIGIVDTMDAPIQDPECSLIVDTVPVYEYGKCVELMKAQFGDDTEKKIDEILTKWVKDGKPEPLMVLAFDDMRDGLFSDAKQGE